MVKSRTKTSSHPLQTLAVKVQYMSQFQLAGAQFATQKAANWAADKITSFSGPVKMCPNLPGTKLKSNYIRTLWSSRRGCINPDWILGSNCHLENLSKYVEPFCDVWKAQLWSWNTYKQLEWSAWVFEAWYNVNVYMISVLHIWYDLHISSSKSTRLLLESW